MDSSQGDSNLVFIFDNMTRFMAEDSSATYANQGKAFFDDYDAFTMRMRSFNHLKISKEVTEKLMKDITGNSQDGGVVAKALVDPENLAKYVDFYPFFKTLSKMVYTSITMRKENDFTRKVAVADKQIFEKQAQEDLQKKLIESLDFFQIMEDEGRRLHVEEETFVWDKLKATREEIQVK